MPEREAKNHLLFVCTANQQRSPTAERLFRFSRRVEARSCGVSPFAEQPATRELIEWADVIYCMEDYHRDALLQRFPTATGKNIQVLEIPDLYVRDDPHLILVLRNRLQSWLD